VNPFKEIKRRNDAYEGLTERQCAVLGLFLACAIVAAIMGFAIWMNS
jgi:hypothetical protein